MNDTNGVPEFITLIDNEGLPYASFNPAIIANNEVRPLNASDVGINYCTFLSDTLELGRFATGRFSTDLTERDDLILAILSVALILVIEGTLATLLLRTKGGRVNSFGFSVKYFIELARGLKSSRLLRRRKHGKQTHRKKLDVKLLLVACTILSFTFGLEVLILVLSTPLLRDVYNTDTSFQLKEIETPDWNQIKRHIDAAISRPCTAVTLSMHGIDQGKTQISACVSMNVNTSILGSSLDSFKEVDDEVEVKIVTHVHEFGSSHNITIGNVTANYLVRAYFTLGDEMIRIMTKRRFMFNFERRIEMLHKQYIAYLFSEYSRRTSDTRMNIDRLRNLNFTFTTGYGPVVNIVQIQHRQRFRQVASVEHITRVKGIIPTGVASFLFAQAVLKGAFGLGLAGPDRYDLGLGTGRTPPRPAVMWRETGRSLNWLSLTIWLIVSSVVLLLLRFLLNPTGTAEIAFLYVSGTAGSPLYLSEQDAQYFSLPSDIGQRESDENSDERSSSFSEY